MTKDILIDKARRYNMSKARELLKQIHSDLVGGEGGYTELTDVDIIAEILEVLTDRSEDIKDHSHTII